MRRAHVERLPLAPAIAAVSGAYGNDLQASLRSIERTIFEARTHGARLVVFPEAAIGGYMREELVGGRVIRSEPTVLNDPEAAFARLMRAAGDAVVCVGYTERVAGTDGLPYSSAVCLSGDGVLGHHRKVHIPPGEIGIFGSGDGFRAFDTPVGRLGMLLCYDKTFPEAARSLALEGADVVACMAAWPVCRTRPARRVRDDRQVLHFNALDVARAVENQVVWVAANQHGRLGRLRFPGQAKIVDPDGRVLANTGSRAGIALARIDPRNAVSTIRDEISHLGDRMPVAYGDARPAAVA